MTPDETVVLSWDLATDPDSTNRLGFTYNVRVGSAPGRADLLSPMSDLATGRRLLPQPGTPAR